MCLYGSMDFLHKPDEKWHVTSELSVQQFEAEASNRLRHLVEPLKDFPNDLVALELVLGVSEEEAKQIVEQTNTDNLRCAKELEVQDHELTVRNASLETLKLLAVDNDDDNNNADESVKNRTIAFQWQSDYVHRVDHAVLDSYREIESPSCSLMTDSTREIVLTVVVARPYNAPVLPSELAKKHGIRIDKTFLVLGSQKLIDLRQAIRCPSDWAPLEDCSENRESCDTSVACQKYKGCTFYINGTFYNNTESADAVDLSEPIIAWAERRGPPIGPFKRAKMEETQFKELTLRLGQPYVYIHQGTCEHVIIFADVRLADENDPQDRSNYPIEFAKKTRSIVRCQLCQTAQAKWIVFSKCLTRYPETFFCDNCYEMFCLDSEGRKAFEFTMAPFLAPILL